VVNNAKDIPLDDIPSLIGELEAQMKDAAKKQEFEQAAAFRDKIKLLRDRLLGKV
jgi:excinuclease ABC subunit B